MPRRRKLCSEAPSHPSPEEFKNMRYLPPPPRRRIPPPVPSGLEPYLEYEDTVQPLVEELKAQGPLDRADHLLLYRLARLRQTDSKRAEFHKEDARAEQISVRDDEDRRKEKDSSPSQVDEPNLTTEEPAVSRSSLTHARQQKAVRNAERAVLERLEAIRHATLQQNELQRQAERQLRQKQGEPHAKVNAEWRDQDKETSAQAAQLESIREMHSKHIKELHERQERDRLEREQSEERARMEQSRQEKEEHARWEREEQVRRERRERWERRECEDRIRAEQARSERAAKSRWEQDVRACAEREVLDDMDRPPRRLLHALRAVTS
ncbi:hypothetical protein ONZ51_g8730 [Trametes cubensis]|uniref:Uncharacterized protein n=1 Tax=Trametes cubensis TaxID=1111947 RepID=A0AAD7X6B1_9APHY|nr:hypothetical protein ONZ51_g8730 [Trametes cubensis]